MFLCSSCNYASTTKIGKCPDCGDFGTFIKDPTRGTKTGKSKKHILHPGKGLDNKQQIKKSIHYIIKNAELQRIFPTGFRSGGIYLLGGEPGIGKSTIMLQILFDLQKNNTLDIAYFSGEETSAQIIERQERIAPSSEKKKENPALSIYHTTHLEDIITTTIENKYNFIIIDSIQTIYSTATDSIAGSASQVKYCSEKLSERCKSTNTACFIVGHVTKGGEIAGPKYLEHIVDVVLYLEGDKYGQYRFLRCRKNRFGSTDEVGIFEMGEKGLEAVYNLKERIINAANTSIPGNVLTIGVDNGRPVLISLEVLLNKTYGKFPQRIAQGIDTKRLQIIIAILDRYLKLNLSFFDIYVNIPGEFKFSDNGLDLALATAIYSQAKNIIIDKQLIFIGELGLGGQVLPSKLHKKRKNEGKDFDIIDNKRMKNIANLPNIL